ncbi:MAG TPA: tRNA (guanine(46)-N(7))-methyltransferase TrmB [Rhizomicrobium sp.]|nr:tRNA (guanine(46)-N(7))-methyltransferase TrmB [Rhizomicrobium sp.]
MLYGRRKGPKLSAHQEELRRSLLPGLTLRLEKGHDPASYFDRPVDDVWLEVGFGSGEHLLWQAEAHPRIGLIGAEPYISGVAKLLSKLAAAARPSIRIYEGDARDIIDALPAASIGRIFILFPDPWPKTRHHKRRFVQTETLGAIARILKPGGELRLASDDAGYLTYALERLMAHPAFRWTATGPKDWKTRPADWPATRYEAKELHGPPAFLRFLRTDKVAS